jgi:hypothetical protein
MPGSVKNFQRASKLLRQPAPSRIGAPPFLAGETDFLACDPKKRLVPHPGSGFASLSRNIRDTAEIITLFALPNRNMTRNTERAIRNQPASLDCAA